MTEWSTENQIRRPNKLVSQELLRRLHLRRNDIGLIFLAGHLLTLLATGALVYQTQGTGGWYAALFLHGAVIVHLFAPFHETTHKSAFSFQRLNSLVAWFSGLAIIIPPNYFTMEHAAHHTYTQHPEKDPECIPMAGHFWGYWYYATAIPYFQGVVKNLTRLPLGKFSPDEQAFIPERHRNTVVRETRIMLGFYLGLVVISVGGQTDAVLWYWLVPRIVAEPLMRLIRISEHGSCEWVADLRKNTRTTLTLPPVRWLAWNMPFHAEHHAIPNLPFYALPELHQALVSHLEQVDRGYLASHTNMLRNLRRKQFAPAAATTTI